MGPTRPCQLEVALGAHETHPGLSSQKQGCCSLTPDPSLSTVWWALP